MQTQIDLATARLESRAELQRCKKHDGPGESPMEHLEALAKCERAVLTAHIELRALEMMQEAGCSETTAFGGTEAEFQCPPSERAALIQALETLRLRKALERDLVYINGEAVRVRTPMEQHIDQWEDRLATLERRRASGSPKLYGKTYAYEETHRHQGRAALSILKELHADGDQDTRGTWDESGIEFRCRPIALLPIKLAVSNLRKIGTLKPEDVVVGRVLL